MATAVQVPRSNWIPTEFTTTHDTDGLPGWGAVDWFRPAGTVVGAPTAGTVERTSGSAGSRGGGVYGRSVYFRTDDGRRLFLTHFSDLFVRGRERLEAGEPLGRVAPYGRAAHIHVAAQGASDKGGKVNLNVEGGGTSKGGTSRDDAIRRGRERARDVFGQEERAVLGPIKSVGEALAWISDPKNLARIAQVGGGFLLLLIGLVLLGRRLGVPGPERVPLPGPLDLYQRG